MLVPSHPHQAPQRHVRSRLQQVTRRWRRAQSREDQHNSAIRDVVAWRLFTHAIANCYHAAMKLVEKRPFADPEVSARKLVELANAFEPVHDGRITETIVGDLVRVQLPPDGGSSIWPTIRFLRASQSSLRNRRAGWLLCK